jgi:DNA invertase Pin-like site-specific DNA recombinase
MKAIILARVSTEEQKNEGSSLPAQTARLKEYCKRKNFEIIHNFSFDESAYKIKRDEFDKIIEVIGKTRECIAVCFDKVDRLSRNVFDKRVSLLYEMALSGKIEIHFVSDGQILNEHIGATEKFHFQINLGLAKYFSDAISDSVKRAHEQMVRDGRITGRPPVGYMSVKIDEEKRDIVPDPIRAPLIRRAFELYASGNYSVETLRNKLILEGLTNLNGNPIAPSILERMLKNPFFHGIMQRKDGKEFPHRYKTIIDQKLFQDCQDVFAGRRKAPTKNAGKVYAFQGILTCANCGCRYTPETHKGRFVYYSCTNARRRCKKVYVNENDLLVPVFKDLEMMGKLSQADIERLTHELKQSHESKTLYHTHAVDTLQKQYNDAQARIDNLLDLLIDGKIPQDAYDRKQQILKKRQYDLGIQLEDYTKADESYHLAANMVLSIAKRSKDIFESSEPEEKRVFLNYLLQNSTVNGKNLSYSLRSPFNTILELTTQPTRGAYRDLNPD